MERYKMSIVVDKDGKWYVAHCVDLPVTSQGKTIEQAMENLKEAVGLYLKHASTAEKAHLKKARVANPIISTITVG